MIWVKCEDVIRESDMECQTSKGPQTSHQCGYWRASNLHQRGVKMYKEYFLEKIFVIYWSLHVASGILGDTTHIFTAPDKTLKNHSVIIWQYVLEVEYRVWLILYWIVQDCGCINFLYYFLPVVKYMPKRNSYNENLHRLCCKEKTYAK